MKNLEELAQLAKVNRALQLMLPAGQPPQAAPDAPDQRATSAQAHASLLVVTGGYR